MNDADLLRSGFASLEVDASFAEAVLLLSDGSRLCFRHRVGERAVEAEAPDAGNTDATLAAQVLARLSRFRLNAKHLDVQFADGSRWETAFR